MRGREEMGGGRDFINTDGVEMGAVQKGCKVSGRKMVWNDKNWKGTEGKKNVKEMKWERKERVGGKHLDSLLTNIERREKGKLMEY